MRLLLQRVLSARVSVGGEVRASIDKGLCILAGFGAADAADLPGSKPWDQLIHKAVSLRIFPDDAGKMNKSLADHGGDVLLVSQFTLYADCRKGLRPSFTDAAPPEVARALFERLALDMDAACPGQVSTGVFQEEMVVGIENWGPVTVMLDSDMFGAGKAERS